MLGGLLKIRAVTSVIMETIISVAESIPSPTTARLPETRPTIIFDAERTAFPIILIQEALTMRSCFEDILKLIWVFSKRARLKHTYRGQNYSIQIQKQNQVANYS